MNRYKKRVILDPEAAPVLLNTRAPRLTRPLAPEDYQTAGEFWDWGRIFPRPGPVEAEIGFGTGRFLLAYARRHADRNLLGMEITRKMAWHAANQVHAAGLDNVRVALGDALVFLARSVAPRSLAAVHAYFPDPWTKKRHWKRRLAGPLFFLALRERLRPGGRFYFATDHAEYLAHLEAAIQEFPEFRPAGGDPAAEFQSSYEVKWRRMDRQIYYRTYQLS